MILLAGAAVALGEGVHLLVFLTDYCTRFFLDIVAQGADLFRVGPVFGPAVRSDLRNTLWYAFQIAEMILFGMTPAFLILRLRKPRPAVRELLHQPGFVASLAMIFGLFWGIGFLLSWFPERFDGFTAAPSAEGAERGAGLGRPCPDAVLAVRAGLDRPHGAYPGLHRDSYCLDPFLDLPDLARLETHLNPRIRGNHWTRLGRRPLVE